MRGSVPLGRDARLLIAGQGVRAAGYGFTAVLLGALLAARGFSHLRAGIVLTPVGLAGAGCAWLLSAAVEAAAPAGTPGTAVHRLAGLFAVDAGGGGLV